MVTGEDAVGHNSAAVSPERSRVNGQYAVRPDRWEHSTIRVESGPEERALNISRPSN